MSDKDKNYIGQMILGAIVYIAVTAASVGILKYYVLDGLGLRTLIALAPMVPVFWIGNNIVKYTRQQDELQQRIQLDAVVFSTVVTALLTSAYGFMEGVGYPELDTVWIMPMLAVFWVVGQILSRRRYL